MEIENQAVRSALVQPPMRKAKFAIGQVVKHRIYPFRGVIFDVDPVFANSDEWYDSIPEAIRPRKDQPFYHLLAENAESSYVAYVSQQNLVEDDSDEPVDHPGIAGMFDEFDGVRYPVKAVRKH
jgi:heat shock protein HspQ